MNRKFLAASIVAGVFLANVAPASQSPAPPRLPYADRIADKNKMIREGLSGAGAAPNDVTYHADRLEPRTMVLGLDVESASKAFLLDAPIRSRWKCFHAIAIRGHSPGAPTPSRFRAPTPISPPDR